MSQRLTRQLVWPVLAATIACNDGGPPPIEPNVMLLENDDRVFQTGETAMFIGHLLHVGPDVPLDVMLDLDSAQWTTTDPAVAAVANVEHYELFDGPKERYLASRATIRATGPGSADLIVRDLRSGLSASATLHVMPRVISLDVRSTLDTLFLGDTAIVTIHPTFETGEDPAPYLGYPYLYVSAECPIACSPGFEPIGSTYSQGLRIVAQSHLAGRVTIRAVLGRTRTATKTVDVVLRHR